MTLPSLRGHPRRHRRSLPRAPHHRGAEASAGCRGSATGELLTAIGMTEPGGGSDLATLKTTAVRDGDDWIINGSKTFITNGGSRRHGAGRGPHQPGEEGQGHLALRRRHHPRRLLASAACSTRSARTSPTPPSSSFENVRVSNDDLVGPLDTGFISMMQFLPQERLGSAITNLAHAKQILEETIQYAKDRQAFGQPIGSLPEQPSSCSPTWSPASTSPRRTSTSASSRTPRRS